MKRPSKYFFRKKVALNREKKIKIRKKRFSFGKFDFKKRFVDVRIFYKHFKYVYKGNMKLFDVLLPCDVYYIVYVFWSVFQIVCVKESTKNFNEIIRELFINVIYLYRFKHFYI